MPYSHEPEQRTVPLVYDDERAVCNAQNKLLTATVYTYADNHGDWRDSIRNNIIAVGCTVATHLTAADHERPRLEGLSTTIAYVAYSALRCRPWLCSSAPSAGCSSTNPDRHEDD
ncbi:hypothetical protein ACWEOE_34925 [Amycolatopsis sp. NPDC004368]